MDTESIKMSAEEIQNFLEQLWIAVSDPRNDSTVKWVKGGRVFRVIKDEIFYNELCPRFCAGCDKNYFDYFVKICGFKRIPPLDYDFFHEDFVQHEIARIKKIQPTQSLYTPVAYYSYVLETPNHEIPSIHEEESPIFGFVEETVCTLKRHGSRKSKAALEKGTSMVIETLRKTESLGSSNNLKETFSLDLIVNLTSDDHSLESSCSTLSAHSFPSPDSGISCFTSESLYPTETLKAISMKKDYEKDLSLNLDDCKLEEPASDYSGSTLTSGSNSPIFPASDSPTDSKSNESSDIPTSKDNIKYLTSTFEHDLISRVENEESADLKSVSVPKV